MAGWWLSLPQSSAALPIPLIAHAALCGALGGRPATNDGAVVLRPGCVDSPPAEPTSGVIWARELRVPWQHDNVSRCYPVLPGIDFIPHTCSHRPSHSFPQQMHTAFGGRALTPLSGTRGPPGPPGCSVYGGVPPQHDCTQAQFCSEHYAFSCRCNAAEQAGPEDKQLHAVGRKEACPRGPSSNRAGLLLAPNTHKRAPMRCTPQPHPQTRHGSFWGRVQGGAVCWSCKLP